MNNKTVSGPFFIGSWLQHPLKKALVLWCLLAHYIVPNSAIRSLSSCTKGFPFTKIKFKFDVNSCQNSTSTKMQYILVGNILFNTKHTKFDMKI